MHTYTHTHTHTQMSITDFFRAQPKKDNSNVPISFKPDCNVMKLSYKVALCHSEQISM